MITYLYWIAVTLVAAAALLLPMRFNSPKIGILAAVIVILVGWAAYFFHYQQIFVKHFGGVMTIQVPEGQVHISATWKDDNLWVENYDPATNTCYFNEYSRGNLLEGKVVIQNCNPKR